MLIHWRRRHSDRLDRIAAALDLIGRQQMADFSALRSAVARIETVQASAIALIREIVDALRTEAGDVAAVAELASQLEAHADTLAAAVEENTPTEPPV